MIFDILGEENALAADFCDDQYEIIVQYEIKYTLRKILEPYESVAFAPISFL